MPQLGTYQAAQYGIGGQYSPSSVQYQQQQNQQNNNNNTNIVWIQGGLAGAKAYPVPPGCAYSLWDSERNTVYVKIVDAAGIPQPIRIFDYNERLDNKESLDNEKGYVTEERLNEILDEKFASFAQSIKHNNKKYSNRKGGRNYGKPTIQSS